MKQCSRNSSANYLPIALRPSSKSSSMAGFAVALPIPVELARSALRRFEASCCPLQGEVIELSHTCV
ncbi:hypothetical protein XENTR_v10015669 [Xenopus tropicalis]|nr:hypothetical protein XENTR_v10015669 [Xenopus tropicalis]